MAIKSATIFCFCLCFLASAFSAKLPRAEVKNLSGNPTLFVNGESVPPFAYMSYLGETKYYKQAADAGIHLYCFPAYLGERGINSTSGIGPFRPPIWIGENQFDFNSLISDFEKILAADQQARVIIRFYLDPPLWWEKQNPDACCQLLDGSTFRQCFSSVKWREQTGNALEYCINWLLDSQYSKHLVGIHVAAGFTEEWFYHPRQYQDQNPARLNAFREWLVKKYGDDLELQKAWNDKDANFETAQLANIEHERRDEWRNPDREQNVVDTFQFHTGEMVKNIAYFCKVAKETSDNSLLTGAFYGYHYFVGDPKRGHGALGQLLECPYLDYLSSPNVYNRVIGEDWPPMVAVQSVKLHGKLWLAENDTRTFKTTLLKDRSTGIAPPGQYESGVWLGPKDEATSVSFLWKNAGRMLAYGYGGWWFDMWGGWFSHPSLLNVLEKTQQLYAQYPPQNAEKMRPEVCVIVDEELCFWDASHGRLTGNILSNRSSLAKTGTSYDLYLRSDLEAIAEMPYKVIWLMGIPQITPKEEHHLKRWQQRGTTVALTDLNGTSISTVGNIDRKDAKFKWSPLELRQLWKAAGVHIYVDSDDVVYAGNNWLCLHTVDGGKRTISLPFYAKVENPIEEKVLADFAKSVQLKLLPKSTTLLRVLPH